ncbi:MAG: DNA-directed RNA polymerase subunit L [Desulfurococcaceae archaeon]|jgi:DNA-directed RNA polymerase subunit L
MIVRILSRGDKEIVLEIEGEDHTLGNMMMKEALRHPGVEHATYRVPHPLKPVLEFTLVVKNGENVGKVLKDVIDSLRKQLEEFKLAVENVLG